MGNILPGVDWKSNARQIWHGLENYGLDKKYKNGTASELELNTILQVFQGLSPELEQINYPEFSGANWQEYRDLVPVEIWPQSATLAYNSYMDMYKQYSPYENQVSTVEPPDPGFWRDYARTVWSTPGDKGTLWEELKSISLDQLDYTLFNDTDWNDFLSLIPRAIWPNNAASQFSSWYQSKTGKQPTYSEQTKKDGPNLLKIGFVGLSIYSIFKLLAGKK